MIGGRLDLSTVLPVGEDGFLPPAARMGAGEQDQ
jgi:hypothetical protein